MSTQGTLSLLQLTDLHILPSPGEKMLGVDTEFYFEAVLQHVRQTNTHYDLILVTGDLTQDPCSEAYQRIFGRLHTLAIDTLCLPGNHDDYALMQQWLNQDNISCKKHIEFEHWQVLCLNSQIPGKAEGSLSENELRFIEDALEKKPNLFTLIAVHHHCVPTRSSWMDTMIIKNSDEFLEISSRYPQIRGITTGHIHQEMDIYLNLLRILGTPSTCFQFKPLCSRFTLDDLMPGYRTIELHPDGRITTQVQRLPGILQEIDRSCTEY
ncbi:3',5'-cyclic-AMP phosphodiesterase [Methylotuvimicrobium alcaliphilum]|uniref:Protein icc homolog n=1 Tax=Methylotuvimicrobium alcaliphilum (strain DSM 19304 / NCIMB 14124 / VKM B-2133 / 20Z) TaxID=1091494 RepID=G4T1P7_META2|nr:3',5'-cyclic-AMP phosphodiesterase [Methylotuvimicrobium alcaliphilum]CCE23479.1 Protein icc homolog [Methylotuvimicrobium alcaliphilum 20Z]